MAMTRMIVSRMGMAGVILANERFFTLTLPVVTILMKLALTCWGSGSRCRRGRNRREEPRGQSPH